MTSTTEGADLLVSGPDGITRYALGRPDPDANTLVPTEVGTVAAGGTPGLAGR